MRPFYLEKYVVDIECYYLFSKFVTFGCLIFLIIADILVYLLFILSSKYVKTTYNISLLWSLEVQLVWVSLCESVLGWPVEMFFVVLIDERFNIPLVTNIVFFSQVI